MKKTITQKKKKNGLNAGKTKNVLLKSFITIMFFIITLISVNAQNSCSNANVFNNSNLDSTLTYNNNGSVYWIKFVATNSNYEFKFSEALQTPFAGILYFNLYKGGCSNLELISTDSINFKVVNLLNDNTYYLEIHKSDTSLSYFNLKISIDTNNYSTYKIWTNNNCPPANCDLIMNPGFNPIAGWAYNNDPFKISSAVGEVCGWLALDNTPNLYVTPLPGSIAPYAHMWTNAVLGGNIIFGEAIQQQITSTLSTSVTYQLSFRWRQLAFTLQQPIDELCFYLVDPNVIPNINTPYFYDGIGLDNPGNTGLRNVFDNAIMTNGAVNIANGDTQFFNLSNTTTWTTVTMNFNVPNLNTNRLVIFPLRNTINGANIEIDEVHITYVPNVTISSSQNPICANTGSTTLIASGALNYVWNNGLGNTATIFDNPLTTTTYTVIGTDINGCSNTATETIAVVQCNCQGNPMPINSTYSWSIPSPLVTGNAYYFTSDVTVISGTNAIISDNIISFDPNFKIIIQNNATLTINHCHIYACTAMWDGIVVEPGGHLIVNPIISTGTTLIEDAYTAVHVTTPTTTTSININDAIFNRNTDGIVVETYHDVLNLQYPNFVINNSVFTSRELYTCLPPYICPPWQSVSTLQTQINTGLLTEHYDLDSYIIESCKDGNPANSGITLKNVGAYNGTYHEILIDGDNTGGTINLFDNLYFGIRATNSNFTCQSNAFQNIIGEANYNNGYAIAANNSTASAPILNRMQVLGGNNYFYENKIAIACADYDVVNIDEVDIRSTQTIGLMPNAFYSGLNGIWIESPHSSGLDIYHNMISNVEYGIIFRAVNHFGSTLSSIKIDDPFKIHENTIQADMMGQNNFETELPITENVSLGIAVINLLNTINSTNGCGHSLNVDSNSLYEVRNGILMQNWDYINLEPYGTCYGNRPVIMSNYIELVDPQATSQFGIYTSLNWNSLIYNNNVDGFSNANRDYYGICCIKNTNQAIPVPISGNNYEGQIVQCNTTNVTGTGIEFEGPQDGTIFINNSMDANKYGFMLVNNGIIGQQGSNTDQIASDNSWDHTTYSVGQYQTWTEYSDPTFSPLVIIQYDPDKDPTFTGYNGSNPLMYNYSIPTSLIPFTGSTDLNPGCPVLPVNKSFSTNNPLSWMEKLVMDSVNFDNFANEEHINALFSVYWILSLNPDIKNYSKVLDSFYISAEKGNIGKLVKTESTLESGDLKTAMGYIANLIPQNRIERSYKKFYTIYNDYMNNEFSYADSIMLHTLVNGCPVADGNAVLKARTLYDMIYHNFNLLPDNCTKPNQNCDNDICGVFNDSYNCGGGPVLNDTLYIVDENNVFVSSVSPVITNMKNGGFTFDAEELLTLDTTALYNIKSKSGFELNGYEPMILKDWISNSPLTLSSDQNLNQEWVAKYTGPDALNDYATALDLVQNIYVVGISEDDNGLQFAAIKYDSTGAVKWVSRLNKAFQDTSLFMTAIKADISGNVYIAGGVMIDTNNVNVFGLALGKIDSSGELKWGKIYDNLYWNNSNNIPSILRIDFSAKDSSIVIGCNNYANPGFILAKYKDNGEPIWSIDNNSAGIGNMSLNSMVIGPNGTIIVSGEISSDWGETGNFITVVFNSNGYPIHIYTYPYTEELGDGENYTATSNVIDRDGNIYITGYGGYSVDNIVTIRYNPSRADSALWVVSYNAEDLNYDLISRDYPNKLLYDKSDGSIYL